MKEVTKDYLLEDPFYKLMADHFKWWHDFNYGEEAKKSNEFILSCLTDSKKECQNEEYKWKR